MRRVLSLLLITAGVIGLGLGIYGRPASLFEAWLIAWLIAIGPGIGAIFIGLLGVLAPGPWYERIAGRTRPFLFALPLASLGIVPVGIGLGELYPWVHAEGHTADLVAARGIWLEPGFFIVRQVVWLAILSGLAALLATGRLTGKGPAGGAAILATLAASGLAFDISMTLDPAFHSTILGLYVLAAQTAGAFGVILALTALSGARRNPLHGRPVWLLFGTCALWGYFAFMQYLVIWSGDLPHFAAWYLDRNQGGWLALFIAVCLLFAAPATFLLQPVRHSRAGSVLVCAAVLLGFALETVWRIAPSLDLTLPGWSSLAGLALLGTGLTGLTLPGRAIGEAAHG